MSERTTYPAGVPCWVTVLQADVPAGVRFYGELFGWELVGSGQPGDESDAFFVARLGGRDVAGIAPLPPMAADVPAAWTTHIRVDRVEQAAAAAAAAGGTVLQEPLDVAPAGRLAVVADPVGAVFCLWEAGTREGAQLVNEPGAWAMSTLQTNDQDSAIAFYGAVFGWQVERFGPPEEQVTLWRLPGYVGGEPEQPVARDVVGVMAPLQAGTPHWSVDFWVKDADATAQLAADLGGQVLVPPSDRPGFRVAVLADPQGAIFSVSQLEIADRS